jgi:hypothetical protein
MRLEADIEVTSVKCDRKAPLYLLQAVSRHLSIGDLCPWKSEKEVSGESPRRATSPKG